MSSNSNFSALLAGRKSDGRPPPRKDLNFVIRKSSLPPSPTRKPREASNAEESNDTKFQHEQITLSPSQIDMLDTLVLDKEHGDQPIQSSTRRKTVPPPKPPPKPTKKPKSDTHNADSHLTHGKALDESAQEFHEQQKASDSNTESSTSPQSKLANLEKISSLQLEANPKRRSQDLQDKIAYFSSLTPSSSPRGASKSRVTSKSTENRSIQKIHGDVLDPSANHATENTKNGIVEIDNDEEKSMGHSFMAQTVTENQSDHITVKNVADLAEHISTKNSLDDKDSIHLALTERTAIIEKPNPIPVKPVPSLSIPVDEVKSMPVLRREGSNKKSGSQTPPAVDLNKPGKVLQAFMDLKSYSEDSSTDQESDGVAQILSRKGSVQGKNKRQSDDENTPEAKKKFSIGRKFGQKIMDTLSSETRELRARSAFTDEMKTEVLKSLEDVFRHRKQRSVPIFAKEEVREFARISVQGQDSRRSPILAVFENHEMPQQAINLKNNLHRINRQVGEEIESIKEIAEFIRNLTLLESKNAEGIIKMCRSQSILKENQTCNDSLASYFVSIREKMISNATARIQICQEVINGVVDPMMTFYTISLPKYKKLQKRINNLFEEYQSCLKGIDSLKASCEEAKNQFDTALVEGKQKNIKRCAEKMKRYFNQLQAELQNANLIRQKIWEQEIQEVIIEFDTMERDRTLFLYNRLNLVSKIQSSISTEAADIMSLLSECTELCEPLASSEKWVTTFTKPVISRTESTLESLSQRLNWPLAASFEDIQNIIAEVSEADDNPSFYHDQSKKKLVTDDDEWKEIMITLSEEDLNSIFVQAKTTVVSEDGMFKANKGDVMKVLRQPEKDSNLIYVSLLVSCPPFPEGWICLNNLEVLFPDEDMPFGQCMHIPGGAAYFTEYLKLEHSEEHVVFWTCCNQYYEKPDPGTAQGILETFLNSGAPFQINIPHTLRDKILKQVASTGINRDMFKEAQTEVYSVLRNDNYQRFRNSSLFKRKFLQALTRRPNIIAKEISNRIISLSTSS